MVNPISKYITVSYFISMALWHFLSFSLSHFLTISFKAQLYFVTNLSTTD